MIRRCVFFNRQQAGFITRTLPALLLCAVLLTACAGPDKSANDASQLSLCPITESPTNISYPGKIVWHDMLTNNSAAAQKFYGELFGWTFQQQGTYAVALLDGRPIAGILEHETTESVWLISMSVPDVDKALEQALAKGSTVVTGPIDITNRGWGVLIKDPQGAHIVLLHATDGDPVDAEAPMGGWLWNELWTKEPEQSADFYSELGQYDGFIQGENYKILTRGEKWRCGLRTVEKEDRWVPIIRVSDLQATVNKAEKLGATVWVRPDEAPGDEEAALLSDTSGALFMIQRWTTVQPTTTGEGS